MDLRFMRHRSKYDGIDSDGSLIISDGSRRDFTTHAFQNFEEFYDTSHGRGKIYGFQYPGSALHVKIKASPGYYLPWQDWNYCTPFRWRQSMTPEGILGRIPSIPQSLLNDVSMAAFDNLCNQVPKTMSIPNFIYELKDFKEAAKGLSKLPDRWVYAARFKGIKAPKGTTKKWYKRHYVKRANNAYLSYSFQWAPFISDLGKLASIGDRVTKRLAWLRSTRGRIVPVRYYRTLNGDWQHVGEGRIEHVDDHPMSYYGENNRCVLEDYNVEFHATGYLYHELLGLDDAWTNWKAFLAASGFNNPLSIVWQAMPYSFLADWVAPIGKWLDTYCGIQPFPGLWTVRNMTHSIKETGLFTWYQEFYPDYGNSSRILGRARFERFTRELGLPPLDFRVDLDLSPTQQSLFGSLVAAKVLP